MEHQVAPFILWLEYFDITPEALAIFLSTIVAGWYARRTIKHSQAVAKLRLTFETVQRTLWDNDYVTSRTAFNRLRNAKEGLVKYASFSPGDEEELAHIRQILNDYENMCIGMKTGIIDEQYVYYWQRSTFINDWEAAKGFVMHVRNVQSQPKLFETFEEIAENWKTGNSTTRPGKKLVENTRVVTYNNHSA